MDLVTIHTAKTTLLQLLARVEAGDEALSAEARTAIADALVLVSNERIFDAYGVRRLW